MNLIIDIHKTMENHFNMTVFVVTYEEYRAEIPWYDSFLYLYTFSGILIPLFYTS